MLNLFLSWYPTLTQNDTLDMATMTIFANNVSHGILFPIILLTVFLITLIGMTFSGQSISRSVLFGGLFCSVLAVPSVLMNLINIGYMYFAFFITAVGALWTWLSQAPS